MDVYPLYAQCLCASDTLELLLQMVMSPHVGAENQTQVLCKSSQCSELLSCLSGPVCLVFIMLCVHFLKADYLRLDKNLVCSSLGKTILPCLTLVSCL